MLKRGLCYILLLLFVFITASCVLSRIPVKEKTTADTKDFEVYIKTNGVHTDVVIPVKTTEMDWSNLLKYQHLNTTDTNFKYVGIGWGDKGFYLETPTWGDLKFKTAFKAGFGLGSTAIHATYFYRVTENETCKKISISKQQYNHLVTYIKNSFQVDSLNQFVNIKTNAVYGNTDAFYEAKGKYSLFKTCNTWTNNALKASGQRACVWTIFQSGIFYQLNKSQKSK